jgi:hypothetical protein
VTIVSLLLCDYCAHEIEFGPGWVKLTQRDQTSSTTVADYHRKCWLEIEQAIILAQDVGGGLERVVVASEAAIAELRRRHLPPGSESA